MSCVPLMHFIDRRRCQQNCFLVYLQKSLFIRGALPSCVPCCVRNYSTPCPLPKSQNLREKKIHICFLAFKEMRQIKRRGRDPCSEGIAWRCNFSFHKWKNCSIDFSHYLTVHSGKKNQLKRNYLSTSVGKVSSCSRPRPAV